MTVHPLKGPKLQHDGKLDIAVGSSRTSKQWVNTTFTLSSLLGRFANPTRGKHTVAEYHQMTREQRDNVKDVGGYLKGVVRRGLRRAGEVQRFQLISLDIDHGDDRVWEKWCALYKCASWLHTTHSHTPNSPRYRLMLPLARPVTGDELQAVSRKLAEQLGMGLFDVTTFQPERLNYWPSCPADAEYEYLPLDGPWLDPDTVLATYNDWRDVAEWPRGSNEDDVHNRLLSKAEDPLTKHGIVGAFCRTYSIQETIEKFIPEAYTAGKDESRYTYARASTTNGAVIYEDKWLYSWHESDPGRERLLNAFDLVRIHRFGHLDEEAKPNTPINRLPSYISMADLAKDDEQVRKAVGQEAIKSAIDDFGADAEEDTEWMARLEVNRRGEVKATRDNILIVLENDPNLKGAIALNTFTYRMALLKAVPWRDTVEEEEWTDSDDAGLRHYLERVYGIDHTGKTADALNQLALRHEFHPVRDYLNSLKWDGAPRVDRLFVEYLNADNTPYTHTVTRKSLVAAVARVFEPGIKYDYILVLVGPQGVGKSLILSRLAKKWFNDSLTTVQGKDAYEQLIGSWIFEFSELAATRKAERENVKQFLSKTEDTFRVPYGRHVQTFLRQCVFFGTTNEYTFLRDDTGNRRFWPVSVERGSKKLVWKHFTDQEVDQVWAEVMHYYRAGETLFLPRELESQVLDIQRAHLEESDKAGSVWEYLDTPLPDNWENMSLGERRDYLHGGAFGEQPTGTVTRDRVCALEVWCEHFVGDPKDLSRTQAVEIHSILRSAPGWEYVGKQRRGSLYGVQRCYERMFG